MIIYKATNKINGKVYIGQTKRSLQKRIEDHIIDTRSGMIFPRAIRKYGVDGFDWEILCECSSKNEMNDMEIYYIKEYNSNDLARGYNLTKGGTGGNCGNQFTSPNGSGKVPYSNMTPEEKDITLNRTKRGDNHYTKRLMSEEQRHEWISNRTGENSYLYGVKWSDDRRIQHSKRLKGKYVPPRSEETKRKIGDANTGSGNGMSKTYKIIHPNGDIEIIKGLLCYCRENAITVFKLKKMCLIERMD